MANYRTGTVSIDNGSNTVIGTGTAYVANARPGQMIQIRQDLLEEIIAVVSDNEITIGASYTGPNISGAAYQIVPVQGDLKSLVTKTNALISEFEGIATTAGAGKFAAGSAAAPSVRGLADQDTGWDFPGGNRIDGITNGTRRVRISDSGMELDGLLSGTVATQGPTDDTTGRVLRTDHGYSRGQLRVESGLVTLSDPTGVSSWLSTGAAFASVALSPAQPDADYEVHVELHDASDIGLVGEVKVYDKATNGFKIRATGSATNVVVGWTLIKRA